MDNNKYWYVDVTYGKPKDTLEYNFGLGFKSNEKNTFGIRNIQNKIEKINNEICTYIKINFFYEFKNKKEYDNFFANIK